MLCMVLITFRLYKTDKSAYKWYLYTTIFIIIVNAVLFVTLGMVSSALEIFFTISSVILLQNLRNKVADMDK